MAGAIQSDSALTPDPRLPHHPGMDRRRFVLTALAGALAVPLAAEAQPAGKVYRVGRLAGGTEAPTLEISPSLLACADRLIE
jgi:hypothetical protein